MHSVDLFLGTLLLLLILVVLLIFTSIRKSNTPKTKHLRSSISSLKRSVTDSID